MICVLFLNVLKILQAYESLEVPLAIAQFTALLFLQLVIPWNSLKFPYLVSFCRLVIHQWYEYNEDFTLWFGQNIQGFTWRFNLFSFILDYVYVSRLLLIISIFFDILGHVLFLLFIFFFFFFNFHFAEAFICSYFCEFMLSLSIEIRIGFPMFCLSVCIFIWQFN